VASLPPPPPPLPRPPSDPVDQFEQFDELDEFDGIGAAGAHRPPRPGELTPGWSVVFGLCWLTVAVAFAAVWNVSRQLGLSTWWLGPPAQARPVFVMVLPFVAPALLTAAAFNRVRYLPWMGLAGAAVTALVGIADLDRVRGIGLVELAIAAAAAIVSLAATTGMYRSVAANEER
jgi:hypothetical protein